MELSLLIFGLQGKWVYSGSRSPHHGVCGVLQLRTWHASSNWLFPQSTNEAAKIGLELWDLISWQKYVIKKCWWLKNHWDFMAPNGGCMTGHPLWSYSAEGPAGTPDVLPASPLPPVAVCGEQVSFHWQGKWSWGKWCGKGKGMGPDLNCPATVSASKKILNSLIYG